MMNPARVLSSIVLTAGLAAFAAAQDAPPAAPPAAAAEGHVILRVNGVPITKSELDASVAYRKTYVAGRSEKDLQRAALEDELIGIAALRAQFASKLPEMKAKIDELRAKVAAGASLEDVARAGSECTSAPQGGDLGFFGRTQMVQPFSRHGFTLGKGEVSEPFLTVFGYHFITVTDYKKGSTAGADQARASHVLVMFDRNPAFRNQIQVIQQAAKVEVVDPAYADIVPDANKNK